MKIRKGAALLALVISTGALTLTGASAAQAADAPDCKTVVSTLQDHPDNGHGAGGTGGAGHWADVSGTRTVTVCALPTPALPEASKSLVVQEANFKATIVDEGTFKTFAGAHLSPAHGHQLLGGLVGQWHGGWSVTFKAPKPTAPGTWPNWSPSSLSGKTFTGAPGGSQPTTSNWVAALWSGVELGQDVHGTSDYSWKYTRCNEYWVDAWNNEDGTTPQAGDITGLSPFHYDKCVSLSYMDQCDGGIVVVFVNAGGLDVYGAISGKDGYLLVKANGKTNAAPLAPISHKVDVTVSFKLRDKYVVFKRGSHTWVQPKDCVKPSTSASAPTVPGGPADNGGNSLPVTGPNIWVLIGVAVVLGVGGSAAILAARKRRIKFTA